MRRLVCAACLLAIPQFALAGITIDTLPANAASFFGETYQSGSSGPTYYGYIGQTFVAPLGKLESGKFDFTYNSGTPNQQEDFQYRVLVTDLSGSGTTVNPTGILFESPIQSITLGAGNVQPTIDFGHLPLVPGHTYAVLLDPTAGLNGVTNWTAIGVRQPGAYSGGAVLFSPNFDYPYPGDRAAQFAA